MKRIFLVTAMLLLSATFMLVLSGCPNQNNDMGNSGGTPSDVERDYQLGDGVTIPPDVERDYQLGEGVTIPPGAEKEYQQEWSNNDGQDGFSVEFEDEMPPEN